MNEKNPERQLTRRELRLLAAQQEAASAQSVAVAEESTDTAAISVHANPAYTPEQLEIVAELEAAVKVPKVDADGNPLDRRAQRRARRRAFEELLAGWEVEHGPLTEYGVKPEAKEPESDEAASAEPDQAGADSAAAEREEVADGAAETVDDADDPHAEDNAAAGESATVSEAHMLKTQALSLEEIAEAESVAAEAGEAEAEEAVEDAAEADVEVAAAEGQKKRRWPFGKKDKAAEAESLAADAEHEAESADATEVADAEVTEEVFADTDEAAEEAAADADTDADTEDDEAAAEPEVLVPAVDPEQSAAEAEIMGDGQQDTPAPKSAKARKSTAEYSFPDIVPLDNERSVFDEGSERDMGGAKSGFDALINRVVEDETSATVTSGTAALILPNIPSDAVLNGALDEESGIFVSGSIELPQSVGETGGHHSLHGNDTSEQDVLDDAESTGSHTSPVSALRAVSSQHAQSTPAITETKTDNSKGPLVFLVTGGVLVVAAAAVIVGAINGLFG